MIFGAAAIGMQAGAFAADPAAAQYKADKSKADADYKAAKKKCGPLKGNDKDVCERKPRQTTNRPSLMPRPSARALRPTRTPARIRTTPTMTWPRKSVTP
jgi:hypothetical protein